MRLVLPRVAFHVYTRFVGAFLHVDVAIDDILGGLLLHFNYNRVYTEAWKNSLGRIARDLSAEAAAVSIDAPEGSDRENRDNNAKASRCINTGTRYREMER